jgi:Ca-activated chloride channel family protein
MDENRAIRNTDHASRITHHASRIAYCVLRIACYVSRPWLLLVVALLALSACAPAVVRHNEAGNAHFAESVYEDALGEYRLAQVDEPDLAEPYYNAANAYNRLSEIEGALAQTEQALKTADPALAAHAWYNLGNAFFDAEQWAQAVEASKEALRLQPDDLDEKHNLELALQKLQEQQQQQQQQQQEQPEGDQQEQQDQEQAEATPSPKDESAASGDQEQQPTPQPSGVPQEEEQGMTEEQALQLLQALLGDSQTLQERLQEMHQVPGPAPAEDW